MDSWRSSGEADVIDIVVQLPTLDKDPCRYFENQFHSDDGYAHDNKKMILSLSYGHKQNSTVVPASITTQLDRDYGPESSEDEANLRKIFGFLHEPIVKVHGELAKRGKFPRMTAAEFCRYILHEDDSLLLKLVFALGTGHMTVPMKKINTEGDFFSRFMACGVAKEMLQRLELNGPGPFQLMMGDMFQLSGASQDTTTFMSKIRVSAHRLTMERESTKKALEHMQRKIKLHPLDAFSLHFDNCGFLGRKATWRQYTIIQICIIPSEELKKEGFYSTRNQLSRVRQTFDEFIQDVQARTGEMDDIKLAENVARRVVGIRKSDWEVLTTRTLTAIQTAMSLALPDVEACRQLEELGDDFSDFRFPINLGNRIENPQGQANSSSTRPAVFNIPLNDGIPEASLGDEDSEHAASPRKTFYEANDMTLDNVLQEDPNATATVEKIANYLEEASQYDEYDVNDSGGEKPVRDFVAPATCDGAPMKRWLDIKANDIEGNGFENRKFKKATMFTGGFHFQMEFMTMRGRLSRGIFAFFGSLWRPTTPQLEYILSISDPTDYLVEMPQHLLAHYRAASDMLRATLPENTAISPVDVQKHMRQRAALYPTCMAHLFDLRLIEISFMIRDSEKSGEHGDVNLFLTTMRFSLALFTVTHAINYAHIVCDFLEWWQLSSEADRVFFKRWLYTKISPFGKPIWVDKGVEWTIRHIRMFLGKRAKCNQDVLLERTVPDIPFRIKAKSALSHLLGVNSYDDYTTGDWNSKTTRVSKVYFKTVTAIYNTNLWGQGDITGSLHCENPSFFVCAEEGEATPMSNSYLKAFELGEQRAIAYYIEHHITNRGCVKRSEKHVSLKLLPATAAARNKDLDRLRAVRLSTDPTKLQPLRTEFPKKDIVAELDQLRECVYPDIPNHGLADNRETLVGCLCQYRAKYFLDYPEVHENTKESVEALEIEDTFTAPESREEQINHNIYSLDEDMFVNFQNHIQ